MNPTTTSGLDNGMKETAARASWISVFEPCFQCTLCSIATPSSWNCSNQTANNIQGELPTSFKNADLALDTYWTIFSLLTSRLPVPKSRLWLGQNGKGSGMVKVTRVHRDDADREREREEQG